jgi:hypothetical protein
VSTCLLFTEESGQVDFGLLKHAEDNVSRVVVEIAEDLQE